MKNKKQIYLIISLLIVSVFLMTPYISAIEINSKNMNMVEAKLSKPHINGPTSGKPGIFEYIAISNSEEGEEDD